MPVNRGLINQSRYIPFTTLPMYIYRETQNGKAPTSILLFYCLTVLTFPELFSEGHSSLDCDVTMQN